MARKRLLSAALGRSGERNKKKNGMGREIP